MKVGYIPPISKNGSISSGQLYTLCNVPINLRFVGTGTSSFAGTTVTGILAGLLEEMKRR
jgi:hypothetical protein